MLVSESTLLILVFVVIALVIVAGLKFDCNIGMLGILGALILGSWLGGETLMGVITGYWPVSVMFVLIVTSFFFGFANQNGTLAALADRIVYIFKSVRWFAPFSIYLTGLILSALGVGTWAIVFIAPIGFQIAKKAKFDPILVPIAANCACLSAGGLIWTAGGPTNVALLMNAGWDEASATSLAIKFGFASLLPCFVAFVVCYFLRKGWDCEHIIMDKPAPLTPVQKKTVGVIVFVLILNVIPLFLNEIFHTTWSQYLYSHINLQVCAVVGGMLCVFMKLADERAVIAQNIPWSSLLIICGMGMLVQVAVRHGIADVIGGWIASSFPDWAIVAAFALFGGLLSFCCSALSVVYPLMLPMIYGLVQNGSQVSALAMVTSLILTACYTGMCPFSQNGALMLSTADEETRRSLTYRMIFWSFILLVISVVYALIGAYGVWG